MIIDHAMPRTAETAPLPQLFPASWRGRSGDRLRKCMPGSRSASSRLSRKSPGKAMSASRSGAAIPGARACPARVRFPGPCLKYVLSAVEIAGGDDFHVVATAQVKGLVIVGPVAMIQRSRSGQICRDGFGEEIRVIDANCHSFEKMSHLTIRVENQLVESRSVPL